MATTLGDDTGRKGKQVICMPDNVLPRLVLSKAAPSQRWSHVEMVGDKSPDWDIFKTTLTKNSKKLNTTGVILLVLLHYCFHWYFSIKINVAQHQPIKKTFTCFTLSKYIYNSQIYLAWCISLLLCVLEKTNIALREEALTQLITPTCRKECVFSLLFSSRKILHHS